MNPTDSSQNNESLAMSQGGTTDSSGHGGGVGKTTLCHIPPGNHANAHTVTVGNPAVAAHLAHGDKLGACKDAPPVAKPCSDNPGDGMSHDGMAPDRGGGKVAVCHIPPGNPANAHTIVVDAAAVKAHLAHGDRLGVCKGEAVPVMSVDCDGGHGHPGADSSHGSSHDGGTPGGTGGNPGSDTASTGGTLNF